MAFHPEVPGLVVAGTGGSTTLWRSGDSGVSWELLTSRNTTPLDDALDLSPMDVAIDPFNPSRMYAAIRAGIAVYEATRDVSAAVQANAEQITLADTSTIDVTLMNNGPGQAWHVKGNIEISANAELVGDAPAGCTTTAGGLQCEAVGLIESLTISITLRPVGVGPVSVAVSVSSLDPDPVSDNNTVIDTSVVIVESDVDGDGALDLSDNCVFIANEDQRDTDGDGYGNLCDADLNNDGVTNFADLGIFKAAFFGTDADADFDGDGVVNFADLSILRALFLAPPGPGGQDYSGPKAPAGRARMPAMN